MAWISGITRTPARFATACAALAVVCVVALAYYTGGFRDGTTEHVTMLNQALGLSRPGEPVMDFKGETIYRRRPFFYPLETVTRAALQRGLLTDTIWEDTVRANCHVAQADGEPWPPRSRALLAANFLDMGRMRASGQWIGDDGRFTIAIPGDYVIVDERGLAAGPVPLKIGPHLFRRRHAGRVAVLWAPAFARGYSPFHLRDREFPR
jgi:hypothetical protein